MLKLFINNGLSPIHPSLLGQSSKSSLKSQLKDKTQTAVYNRWTGLVDWTSGLDYWTHQFAVATWLSESQINIDWLKSAS